MSLDSIRALRMNRQKPAGVVSIVFTDKPMSDFDSPQTVVIKSTDQPQFLDLRPLVGLWVALYAKGVDKNHFLRTLDALTAAKCKFFGAVTDEFVLPMTLEPTRRNTIVLFTAWEALCL